MASYPTLHEIRAAADDHWQIWQQLLSEAPELRQVIGPHAPTAMGWKVDGEVAPLEAALRLYELGDSLFAGPVGGERAILTLRKPSPVALDSLQDIKILQRRPSRPDDVLGPDSLDLLVRHDLPTAEAVRKAAGKVDLSCEAEHNEAHAWVSVRYMGYEFKLFGHQVWEICAREAAELVGLETAD